MMDYREQIYQSFWQGMLKLVILHQASMRPVYGSELSKYLCGQGYKISPGTLYPLLHTLEQESYLRSRVKVYKGRPRKYYETTDSGRFCLNELRQQICGIMREIIIDNPPEINPTVKETPNNISFTSPSCKQRP
jgi:PadR family transcriptional regulator PadR